MKIKQQQQQQEEESTEQPNNLAPSTPRNSKLLSKVQHRKLDRRRIGIWSILVVESIVCLCSFLPYTDGEIQGVERWTVIVPSISIGVSCIGFLASGRQKTISYFFEGILVS